MTTTLLNTQSSSVIQIAPYGEEATRNNLYGPSIPRAMWEAMPLLREFSVLDRDATEVWNVQVRRDTTAGITLMAKFLMFDGEQVQDVQAMVVPEAHSSYDATDHQTTMLTFEWVTLICTCIAVLWVLWGFL